MLASKYRLKRRFSFAQVELQGSTTQFASFGLGVFDRKDNKPSLFGFVISTRISKKAVIRNKIKRILSETVRINYKKVKPGFDVVFLVKPLAVKKETNILEQEVVNALQKTHLLV